MDIDRRKDDRRKLDDDAELLSDSDDNSDNNKEERDDDSEEGIPDEMLTEKIDTIMKKLEQINVEKEIGEKYKKKDTRIIIEKIILENFKSYAGQRTIGPLHYRFNSVVGPNGSGKSNLMESLLFVFGKRAKNMRLKKLNELIHNSLRENKCKYCKVSVFFREIKEDDDDNYHYIEGGDFVIARTVFKNSSSQYQLNGKESSFDEINSLLNKKDIDLKHNRFLILQGEVEQISMMKPKAENENETGLLEFLEDIIGTRRYVPLIDKLTKSIEDLGEIKTSKANRVKISRNEINELEDVKNQSLSYYHKEKESQILRHLLLIARRGMENNVIISKKNDMEKIQSEIEEIQKKMAEQISQSKNVLLEHKQIQTQINSLTKENQKINEQINKIEENDKLKQNEIENYGKQIKKGERDLEKLTKNYSNKNEEINMAQEQRPKLQKENELKTKIFNEIDSYLTAKDKEIYSKTEKLQKSKKEVMNKLRPSESQINQNNFKIEQNQKTLNLLKEKIQRQEENLGKLKKKKEEVTRLLNEKKENYDKFLSKKGDLETNKTKKEKELREKEKVATQKQREVQEKMLKLSEFKNSNQEFKIKHKITSELIKAQKEGKVQGLLGRLGDLGAIDQKYDIAISTACNQLDYLVVDTTQNARNILTYLRNNNIGTASIIILEKVTWVERYFNKDYQCPPGTQRLFDLVKFEDKRLQNAFYFALRDTLVTSSLEIATQVGYGQNRHRVVTLDGVIVEITGAMVGGGRPRRGLMSNVAMNVNNRESNERELKQLTEEYTEAVNEYNQLKNEYNSSEQEYQRIIRDLRELENVGIKIESDLNRLNQTMKEINEAIKSLREQSNRHNLDLQQINRIKVENEKLTKENNNLKDQTKELRKELEEINGQLDNTYGEEYNKKKMEREILQKEIEEIEKKLNQYENVLLNAQKTLDKLKEEIINKEKTIEELKKRIKECENIMKQYEDDSLKLLGVMNTNNNEIKRLEGQYTEQNGEIEKLKQAIALLRENKQGKENEIKEINEEIRKLNRSIASFNEKININKKSFDKLIQEFGFIDDFDRDIKMINQGKLKKGQSQEESSQNKEDLEMKEIKEESNEEDNEDEEDELIPKKKANVKQFDKYFKTKYLQMEYAQDEVNKLISQTKDIEYVLSLYESQIKNMKPNMQAIIEYKNTLITLRERENDLTNTIEKLQKANDIYQNVKQRRQNEFMEGFNIINSKLIEMYRLLTKGGDAELELADSLDPFNEGITFTVRPNRKCWKSMGNLSGGEKTLSSLSLIFALHHYKPSPLYVMDEIDAALDFRNVSVIAEYIKERTKDSQFIIISLRNQMFELANELIGIYKTFDITKVVVFNPNSYDVRGRPVIQEKKSSKKKEEIKDKEQEEKMDLEKDKEENKENKEKEEVKDKEENKNKEEIKDKEENKDKVENKDKEENNDKEENKDKVENKDKGENKDKEDKDENKEKDKDAMKEEKEGDDKNIPKGNEDKDENVVK